MIPNKKVGMGAFTMNERHATGRQISDDEINALEARAKGAAERLRDLVKGG